MSIDLPVLSFTFFFNLNFVSRAECGAEEAAPVSSSMDQTVKQPPCYIEEEEEEIFISEPMQDITDGILVS